jgi:GNAT superfamily N-acetyltransferase
MPTLDIRRVTPDVVRPMRQQVLRPTRPYAENLYPGDDAAETLHLAAYAEGDVVGSLTTLHQAPPALALDTAWRLRGVATLPQVRGQGYGVAMVQTALAHIREQHGTLCWFFAQATAVGFYLKLGFQLDTAQRYTETPFDPTHPMMWMQLGG